MSAPRPATEVVAAALARHRADPTRLLQILREVQEALDWLSRDTLAAVAAGLGLPLARVEGVAGFYSFLHTQPMGRYRVRWSDNITDRMLGSRELMAEMCRKLWLEPGRVSEDGLVSVAATSCTGLCDQGPALLVNGRAVGGMTLARVGQLVDLIRSGTPLADWPSELFVVADNIRRRNILLDGSTPAEAGLRATLARGAAATLDEMLDSGLRGRGGAGYVTGMKWRACRDAAGPRHVVCNADEGEPGTFKDRVLLASQADRVFEGMTVAGHVVGAQRGLLYLRGEYRWLLEHLEAVLARRRSAGLLGRAILGSACDFDIEIHVGAGAYVCGEESALIESLEGKRGIPRNRPPYPVTHGYLNRPTTVNNVETLATAALIAAHGGAWYRTFGSAKSAGTKLLSISGDCARPGIYEIPFGTRIAAVLADCGADDALAVQISGPSGTCIAADEFERRIGFEDLPTAGAFMVFGRHRDPFEVAHNFAQFFAHESCGFCTPCRVGTTLLKNAMDKIAAGHGSEYDLGEIFRINRLLQTASHCGLGHSACNPLFDTLQKFRPAYERRLRSLAFEPAFDLDAALARARQMTGRDDAGAHFENAPEGNA